MYLPWFPAGLHVIGKCDVVRPHVILPFPQSQDTAQYPARVDAHPHIELDVGGFNDAGDGVDHVQAHLHGAMSVVGARLR